MSWLGRLAPRSKQTTAFARQAITRAAAPRPASACPTRYPSPSAAQQRSTSSHSLAAALDLRRQQQSWSPSRVASSGVHLVDEELCDYAVSLLAPSLEKHKGCNIVDFFPGPGLWSRKIHELLRPRSHVLVDNPQDGYEPFLRPLLEQPGSRFHHLPTDLRLPYEKSFFDGVIAKLDLPAQDEHLSNDEPTNNILVLANMTKMPKAKSSPQDRLRKAEDSIARTVSPAGRFVFDFLQHLQTRSNLHVSGPARLLLWTLDRDKFNFLPRSIAGRQQLALGLDEAFFLREIVGSGKPSKSRRPAYMELQSAIQAAERMFHSGISLPPTRRSLVHENVLKYTAFTSAEHNDPRKTLRKALSELNELETRWALDDSKLNGPVGGRREPTPEYRRMTEIRTWLSDLVGEDYNTDLKRLTDSIHRIVTCQALLDGLERAIASGAPDSLEIRTAATALGPYTTSQLRDRIAAYSARGGARRTATWHRVSDDASALSATPPLLAWDQRPHEPLEPRASDFFPEHSLALLDFAPRPGLDPRNLVFLAPIARALRRLDHLPVPAMLDHVANGAAAALLPRCTALSDPLRGGRVDPHGLRGRLMTHEIWREVVAAWTRWPFRRDDEELLAGLGSGEEPFERYLRPPF